MNYKFGVYGDSIAFGYGAGEKSWFDLLTTEQKSIKLAQNGEKTIDVLNKIKHDINHYQFLIVAIGINDLLQPTDNPADCHIAQYLKTYRKIVKQALNIADKIIVQTVLPVREHLFPQQDWLDEPQWVFNINIQKFNKRLQGLAHQNNALFLDAYSQFISLPLSEILFDAVHPNNKGQMLLAECYKIFNSENVS